MFQQRKPANCVFRIRLYNLQAFQRFCPYTSLADEISISSSRFRGFAWWIYRRLDCYKWFILRST